MSDIAAPPAKLLIVDDESAQMAALCDTLEHEGYVTTGFTSAKEALATLRTQKFDLLLTDLMMPEMDGITLLRAAPRHRWVLEDTGSGSCAATFRRGPKNARNRVGQCAAHGPAHRRPSRLFPAEPPAHLQAASEGRRPRPASAR